MPIEPARLLELTLGARRSEVYRALGLPIERKSRLGAMFGKPTYDGWYLDEGPGYVSYLGTKAFPALHLRSVGAELFFDATYRLKSIWLEPPFALPVHCVRFGMPPEDVVAVHGAPFEQQLNPKYLCFTKFVLPSGAWLNVEYKAGAVTVIAWGAPGEC